MPIIVRFCLGILYMCGVHLTFSSYQVFTDGIDTFQLRLDVIADFVYFCTHDISGPHANKVLEIFHLQGEKEYQQKRFSKKLRRTERSLFQDFAVPFCYLIITHYKKHGICLQSSETEMRRRRFKWYFDRSPIRIAMKMWGKCGRYIDWAAIYFPDRNNGQEHKELMASLRRLLEQKFLAIMDIALRVWLDRTSPFFVKGNSSKNTMWRSIPLFEDGRWAVEDVPAKSLAWLVGEMECEGMDGR
jgi:hypothetical protein